MTQIAQALTRIFDRHRIVFWYDEKQELQAEYEALVLPDVEKIQLDNNQYSVKHRILRQEPECKFLLYHAGPRPGHLDNWLLDVELAYGNFAADQAALVLVEVGLGPEFIDVVRSHIDFFSAVRRREVFKALLESSDTPHTMRLKMLAVCTGANPRLDEILEALLAELAEARDEKMRLVERSNLAAFLWKELARSYGYTSETPAIKDFAIQLFKSAYALGLGEAAALNNDALVFLRRWQNNRHHTADFETLSARYARILGIEEELENRTYRSLTDLDLFELIDRKILSDLVGEVASRTLSATACETQIRRRRQSHWYNRYLHTYEAIDCASSFLQMLDAVDLTVRSLSQGIEQYTQVWYQLDQRYRQFIYHARRSGQTTLLAPLSTQVENLYTNHYLLKVNDLWQPLVDAASHWQSNAVLAQRNFYEKHVRPFVARGNKVFVVISDALRYEVGEELLRLIRQEDRYEATLTPALTTLPSYTQLGMAALLPHQQLSLTSEGGVLVDGYSSQGIENRKKILDRALPGRSTALGADDLLRMNRDESRALFRDHEVVYIYQNRIDAVGDKRDSEYCGPQSSGFRMGSPFATLVS
jgi:uncharacterized protein (TIGR02687 family)